MFLCGPENLFIFAIAFLIPNFINLYLLFWKSMFANLQRYESVLPICVMTFSLETAVL